MERDFCQLGNQQAVGRGCLPFWRVWRHLPSIGQCDFLLEAGQLGIRVRPGKALAQGLRVGETETWEVQMEETSRLQVSEEGFLFNKELGVFPKEMYSLHFYLLIKTASQSILVFSTLDHDIGAENIAFPLKERGLA